ncbi:MAG: mechanosensitive ion channel protein MscS, partial [Cyanobacteria bacterium P01_F01_bin.116]
LDQVSIIVPNSRFLEHDVINWSHRNPLSRIHIPVGVAYGTNPNTVKTILMEVGRDHPQVMAAPAPAGFFKGFGENSHDFELLVWIRRPENYPHVKSDLNFAIAHAFNKLGIEIPFPQRDINLPQSPIPITLTDPHLLQKPSQTMDNHRSRDSQSH